MFTLKSFYRSDAWEKFRQVVIADAMRKDGFVYCARCGKPILKRYDLIVHHKRELDEANVNDAMVALNPANVECVHFKCHNEIHERFQGGDGWKPRPRLVYVVYGSPCSGKTTWVRTNATRNDLVVDMDSIWQCVSVCDPYDKPDRLKGAVFDVRDKLYDVIKFRSGKWQNAFVITGGALKGDRERLRARIGADEFIFIDTDKATCLKRLEHRKCKQDEWRGYIEKWFETFQPD